MLKGHRSSRWFGFAAAVALSLTGNPAQAKQHPHHHVVSNIPRRGYEGGDAYYTNVSGHQVHRPSFGSRPTGATAHCSDGSWSYSEHHRGTCSHHGGVSSWL